jgi:hypothetical protein
MLFFALPYITYCTLYALLDALYQVKDVFRAKHCYLTGPGPVKLRALHGHLLTCGRMLK